MARVRKEEQEFGSESFLDVVANVVGILIILVMVVGMRIQKSSAEAVEAEVPAVDLSAMRSQSQQLSRELDQLAAQIGLSGRELLELASQQQDLAALGADRRREMDQRRLALDELSRRQLDEQQRRAAAEQLASQLERDLETTESSKQKITIESYPTPLSRTVDGKEQHFQLRAGRIAPIPLDELLVKLKADAQSQFWKLKDLPEATATVGPIDGFRLRYTFQRVDVPLEDQIAGRRMVSSMAQLSQWTLIPSDNLLGETLEEALLPQSEFHRALTKHRGRNTTVTLWTYPDSFKEFRRLKKELYQLGFPIAGRPMPADSPIGGSPHGSKSAAQ